MTRDKVWEVLCRHIRDVLGEDIQDVELRPEQNLQDLGANSLERTDVLIGTVDELQLPAHAHALVTAPTLGVIVDLLHASSLQP